MATSGQSAPGVVSGADLVVAQQRHRPAVDLAPGGGCRSQRPINQAGRLGSGIGVEGGFAHGVIAGPEAERDDLVRVGLTSDRIGAVAGWGPAAGEAGHGQVQAVPEQMHRALFAAVPARELLEHGIRPIQDLPEPPHILRVVGGVLSVGRERGGHRHAVGVLADGDVHAQPRQQLVEPAVEAGHRQPVVEPEGSLLATVGPHDQQVVDEVEVDLKADLTVVQPAGGQATDVQVQGHMPPVVAGRGGGQLDLADDLGPQVQGRLGRLPRLQRQLGQLRPRGGGRRGHGWETS
jgi:hypothetical protein